MFLPDIGKIEMGNVKEVNNKENKKKHDGIRYLLYVFSKRSWAYFRKYVNFMACYFFLLRCH